MVAHPTAWNSLRGTGTVVYDPQDAFKTMFDYQFWLALLGTLGTLYSAYWQRRSAMMAIEAQGPKHRRAAEAPTWWKSPSVIALFILVCALWGPFIVNRLSEEPVLRNVTTGMDGVRDNSSGKLIAAALYITVDGNEIYKYAPMRIMAAGFHWKPDRDVDDVDDLQKSAVYDIRREAITFHINVNQKFINEYNLGAPNNYALIVVPRDLTPQRFATLRQAKAAGAKVINLGSYKP
jgi:hypothetical protein